jgi:hypothetical protein
LPYGVGYYEKTIPSRGHSIPTLLLGLKHPSSVIAGFRGTLSPNLSDLVARADAFVLCETSERDQSRSHKCRAAIAFEFPV